MSTIPQSPFRFKPLLLSTSLSLLCACSIQPTPLTSTENQIRAFDDNAKLQLDQETVSGPISLHEAVARALKYNLDYRVEIMQKALAQKQLGLTHYDMLPKLMASLGYDARNNWSGAHSALLDPNTRGPVNTQDQYLQDNTSSDRDIFNARLGLTWNILDFGVSYYRAHQASDKVMAREEEKRKVVNRIVQDVTTAYWRAVSNERLKADMQSLAGRIENALQQSQQVMGHKLSNPMAALTYQRELLSIQRELQQLQRNLELSKSQLAALMNLKPNQDFQLVIPDRSNWNRDIKMNPVEMEQMALENRPELRALIYEKRANANEAKAALVAMLTGIEFVGAYDYNSNSFLFENEWWSLGSQVAWNLMSLVRYPAKMDELDAQQNVLDAERLAMSMAVLTQLHVSRAQFAHARREFTTADGYQTTQAKLVDQVRAGVKTGSISEQGLIREEMNTLVAEVRRDVTYADLENAYAAVIASLGLDPLPGNIKLEQPVPDLTRDLATNWTALKPL
jgi:outer membrane protein TolC